MVKGDGEVKRTVKWRAVIQGTDWHQQGIDKPVPQYDKYPSSCRVKVKVFHYSPGQALRVPGGWGSQISRQSAHEGGKVVSPKHRTPLLPRKYSWYSLTVRAMVRPEGLCQNKISNDTIGNRTRDLPACSAVRQWTAQRRRVFAGTMWKCSNAGVQLHAKYSYLNSK